MSIGLQISINQLRVQSTAVQREIPALLFINNPSCLLTQDITTMFKPSKGKTEKHIRKIQLRVCGAVHSVGPNVVLLMNTMTIECVILT